VRGDEAPAGNRGQTARESDAPLAAGPSAARFDVLRRRPEEEIADGASHEEERNAGAGGRVPGLPEDVVGRHRPHEAAYRYGRTSTERLSSSS